jgi:hypothetical protein
MVAAFYPSSARLYAPDGAFRMSALDKVADHDEAHPNDVFVHFVDGRVHRMETDSPEGALSWIREIQAALFSFRNSAKAVRFNIPLRSIIDIKKQNYMSFGAIVDISFDRTVGDSDAPDDEDNDGTKSVESDTENVFHFYSTRFPAFGAILRRAREEAAKKPIPEGMCKACTSVTGLNEADDLPERAKDRAVEQSSMAAKFRETFALIDDPNDLMGKSLDLNTICRVRFNTGIGGSVRSRTLERNHSNVWVHLCFVALRLLLAETNRRKRREGLSRLYRIGDSLF